MFCRECGQPISETDKFCERCGTKTARAAAVQKPVVSPAASAPVVPISDERAALISSGIRLLPLVGLVAGILCLVAIFTPWTGMRAPAAGISAEATAWDLVINAKIMGEELGREAWAYLALSGAVVIVVASLLALAAPKAKVPWGILGIIAGGLLSLAGALWALSDIDTGTMLGMTVTYGFGLYLTLAGGIVACVLGITGLLFDANKRNALTDIPNECFRFLKDKAMRKEPGSETLVAHLDAEREKHCPGCGVGLPESARTCLECGAKLAEDTPTTMYGDSLTFRELTYRPVKSQEGRAFCFLCRKDDRTETLFYNGDEDAYCHYRCVKEQEWAARLATEHTDNGKAAPVQVPVASPAASVPELAIRRPRTMSTWLRPRLAAAIALIGCIVAFAGMFAPWTVWTGLHWSNHESGSYSVWDAITRGEGINRELHPEVYHWVILVGVLLALICTLLALVRPRLRPFWAATILGGVLALLGVTFFFVARSEVAGPGMRDISMTYGYGAFLTLAGGIIATLGGLVGLVMLTDFHRRRTPHAS